MKQLTIRGVDDNLHRVLREQAQEYGVSVNRFVVNILRESVGLVESGQRQNVVYDDLDHLAGTWSQEEFEQFMADLHGQRGIDAELWS